MEVIGRTQETGWCHKEVWGQEFTFRISVMNPQTFTVHFQALEESGNQWRDLSPLFTHMGEINRLWGGDTLSTDKISNEEALEIYVEYLAEDDLKKAFPQIYKKHNITLLDR